MSRALIESALARCSRAGASQADVLLVESEARETRVRGDEIDFVKQSKERVLGIRALVGSADGLRTAVTSTRDLQESAVLRLAEETVALARATAPDPFAGLPEGGFQCDDVDLGLVDEADRAHGVEAQIEEAREAERAARACDPRITNSEGSESSVEFRRVEHGNSEGFFGSYESGYHGLFCMPIASENGAMQTDYWSSGSRTRKGLEPAEEVGRTAALRALRRLGSRRAPTCEVPVVFDPTTARSLLGHLASCVAGGAIYRKASFLAERLGEVIASDAVTVIDDGRRVGGLASRPFDGEGLPTRRTTVIERGRLSSYLLDAYSARKLELAPTGSASRSPGSRPGAGPTNLWIEPGTRSLDEIVADTERGLLVTWLFGHGFNPVTGDFSRGAAGLWIENGTLGDPVEEITIAGNLGDMLIGIDRVGNDLLWQSSVAAPSIRVARMTVAGE